MVLQTQPEIVQPPPELEVLVAEAKRLVEPAGGVQQIALERDVGGVEAAPAGLACRHVGVVELRTLFQEPHERGHPQLVGPANVPEDRVLGSRRCRVRSEMPVQQPGVGEDVVAEKEDQRGPGRSPARVARGGDAGGVAVQLTCLPWALVRPHRTSHGLDVVVLRVVDDEHLDLHPCRLAFQAVQRPSQDRRAPVGRDDDRERGAGTGHRLRPGAGRRRRSPRSPQGPASDRAARRTRRQSPGRPSWPAGHGR